MPKNVAKGLKFTLLWESPKIMNIAFMYFAFSDLILDSHTMFWIFYHSSIKLQSNLLKPCPYQWRIYIVKFWTRPPPPPRFQILSISCSFGKIWQNRMLAPPPRGNPRSATAYLCLSNQKYFSVICCVGMTSFCVSHFNILTCRQIFLPYRWWKCDNTMC